MTTWRWFNRDGYYHEGSYIAERTALPRRLIAHAPPWAFVVGPLLLCWLVGLVATGDPALAVVWAVRALASTFRPPGDPFWGD